MALNGADRDDAAILAAFDPGDNVHMIFTGWYDMGMAGLPRPIESQAFEAWYLAKYPEKVSPEANIAGIRHVFPDLDTLSPSRQLVRLIECIRKYRKNGKIMNDTLTDRRPLLLPWPT